MAVSLSHLPTSLPEGTPNLNDPCYRIPTYLATTLTGAAGKVKNRKRKIQKGPTGDRIQAFRVFKLACEASRSSS